MRLLHDLRLGSKLGVVRQSVHLVDENLEPAQVSIKRRSIYQIDNVIVKQRGLYYILDFGVDGVCPGHRLRELGDGVVPVVLRVDDEDDGAAPLEDLWNRWKKLDGDKSCDKQRQDPTAAKFCDGTELPF